MRISDWSSDVCSSDLPFPNLRKTVSARAMILVIDNYDSFTFNLVHYLIELGAEVRVERNDALTAAEALGSGADAILISPGPCTPNDAGISLDQIGSASCRERVCQYVSISVVAVSLKKKTTIISI